MLAPRSSQRFPVRTLVLMILAVLAFLWMWVMTHRQRERAAMQGGALQVEPVAPPTGAHPPR